MAVFKTNYCSEQLSGGFLRNSFINIIFSAAFIVLQGIIRVSIQLCEVFKSFFYSVNGLLRVTNILLCFF